MSSNPDTLSKPKSEAVEAPKKNLKRKRTTSGGNKDTYVQEAKKPKHYPHTNKKQAQPQSGQTQAQPHGLSNQTKVPRQNEQKQERGQANKHAKKQHNKLSKQTQKQKAQEKTAAISKVHPLDPSTKYLSAPLQAPIVNEAKLFFRKVYGQTYTKQKFAVNIGALTGWRTQAKIAVRAPPSAPKGEWAPPQIGLFLPKSHNVIHAKTCPVHHESINAALVHIEKGTTVAKVEGYNELLNPGEHKAQRRTGSGHLRYVHLMVERKTKKIQLTLVWNSESLENSTSHLQNFVDFLKKKQDLYHSIWTNFNKGDIHENSIFSREPEKWHKFFGPDTVTEVLDNIKLGYQPKLFFSPNVFRQANLEEFPKIISKIRAFTPKNCKLLELYGGVGTIGLFLLDSVSDYICSDENPNNLECFNSSVEKLPKDLKHKVQPYKMKSATDMIKANTHIGTDLCIVDPPRKGLDPKVLEAFMKPSPAYIGPARLIYVSCGFKALSHDLKCLLGGDTQKDIENGDGCWKLVHSEGFVLFPGSNHLETLVVLDRK